MYFKQSGEGGVSCFKEVPTSPHARVQHSHGFQDWEARVAGWFAWLGFDVPLSSCQSLSASRHHQMLLGGGRVL